MVTTTTTAAGRAYTGIRDAILSAELAEGAPIREDAWAQRLGISRTPVREALRRLSADGLVELLPSRGARVIEWATEDLDDLFRVRALVESFAAEVAAGNRGEDHLAGLWELQEQMERTARASDEESRHALGRLDVAMHRAIVAASGSDRLIDTHDRLIAVPTQHRTMPRYSKVLVRERLSQHREVVRAIELGDTEWAGAMMRAHVLSGWRLMLEQRERDADSMQSRDA